MNKRAALIIALILTLSFNHAFAQDVLKTNKEKATKRDTKTYHIISIDGKNQIVTIIPDYENHELKITSLQQTISIQDFWGAPPEIRLLNKSFIEINYPVRGGSNLGLGNTLIICINGKHLYEAMYILSYSDWDAQESRKYNIKFTLKGNSANNYKLHVHVHDDADSNLKPETNYVYDNDTVLAFDTRQNVFYSVKDNLYDHFVTAKNKTKQKVAGTFPMIILGRETYYFINGRWYTGDLDKEMFEFK